MGAWRGSQTGAGQGAWGAGRIGQAQQYSNSFMGPWRRGQTDSGQGTWRSGQAGQAQQYSNPFMGAWRGGQTDSGQGTRGAGRAGQAQQYSNSFMGAWRGGQTDSGQGTWGAGQAGQAQQYSNPFVGPGRGGQTDSGQGTWGAGQTGQAQQDSNPFVGQRRGNSDATRDARLDTDRGNLLHLPSPGQDSRGHIDPAKRGDKARAEADSGGPDLPPAVRLGVEPAQGQADAAEKHPWAKPGQARPPKQRELRVPEDEGEETRRHPLEPEEARSVEPRAPKHRAIRRHDEDGEPYTDSDLPISERAKMGRPYPPTRSENVRSEIVRAGKDHERVRDIEFKKRRQDEQEGGERAVREAVPVSPTTRPVQVGRPGTGVPVSTEVGRISRRQAADGDDDGRTLLSRPRRLLDPVEEPGERSESKKPDGNVLWERRKGHHEPQADLPLSMGPRRPEHETAGPTEEGHVLFQRRRDIDGEQGESQVRRSERLRNARGEAGHPSAPDNLEQVGRQFLYGAPTTPSEQRAIMARKVAEAAQIDARRQHPSEPQISWSRGGWNRKMDRTVREDAEVLTREERAVHSELTKAIPADLKMSGVRIADDTSRVHAQVVIKTPEDSARWAQACRDFEARTGRVLEIDVVHEEHRQSSRTLSQIPAEGTTILSRPQQVHTETPETPSVRDKDRDSRIERVSTASEMPSERTVKVAHVAKAAPDEMAVHLPEAIKAEMLPVAARRSELKIGVPGANRFSRISGGVRSGEGGASAQRRGLRRYRPRTEDDDSPQTARGKDGPVSPKEARQEEWNAVRSQEGQKQVDDQAQQEGGKRQRQGASNCPTCGTSLPEAQANACPVCAQSGPDVMALTSVHYRAAGVKFLATVDLFTATEDARELIYAGATPNVVSLRYEQDIPGHKDFLKFKVKA